MIDSVTLEQKAQEKINTYNRIAQSKGLTGDIILNDYRYLAHSLLDVAGNSVCFTCGTIIKDGLPELAQIDEAEGYTAYNIIPVCKHCLEHSRGKNLYNWYNGTYKKFDYNKFVVIKKKIEIFKRYFSKR
ncbi:MAG: hypothetical protein K0Q65_1067 [Clostridia bacterium]|jgi:hypothetical protein|nr:hypothetical protein [Clostridia bacterium]